MNATCQLFMERAHDRVFDADAGLMSLVPAWRGMSPLTVSVERRGDGLEGERASCGVVVAPVSVVPVAVGVSLRAFLAWLVLRRLDGVLGAAAVVNRTSSKLVNRSVGGNSASKLHGAGGTIERGHRDLAG